MAAHINTLPSDPSALKQMEKQILKEGNAEAHQVKHALKDVDASEKAATKAQKSLNKEEKKNEKLNKLEMKAAKDLNKATHRHDTLLNDIQSSERDLKLKHQQDVKLHADLEQKKLQAEELAALQRKHDDEREQKLKDIREAAGGIS
ncbi:unnamed protein product [Mycena citricolor]|uniref:Uncharacterized protein n=1 Tax=Mycena citricolor TaxID=2018698 RepID=A0AAD2Q4R6_9AGAR|nr:unnamed protein product [Mycena citricolor]